MLMSKSRLEKFLYALYSLDSSDLPKPLSRIEDLYNCLVTGEEVPTFKPISRVEKYLMAILGGYDVNSLPNPLSRVEVLLYKLATGDDNLDDVKSFISKHEELLAEIIRNGGVGGDIDIEYILYTLSTEFNTLYNTAEKPVKSAILSGMTLVNLLKTEKNSDYILNSNYWVVEDDYFKLVAPSVDANYQWCTIQHRNGSMLQPNSKYLLVFDVKENSCNGTCDLGFDGHGCNLSNAVQFVSFKDGEIGIKKVIITTSTTIDVTKGLFRSPINLPKGGKLTFRVMAIPYQEGMENWDIPYFEGMKSVQMPVLTTSNEDGTKTNILTTNEEVTLRGIDDVQDTLDLMTGEVVERIGEVIFDGSVDENWKLWATYPEKSAIFRLPKEDSLKLMKEFYSKGVFKFKCDKFSTVLQTSIINAGNVYPHAISFFGSDNDYIQLRVYKSLLKSIDVDGLREYLTNEPITVQYQLATESVKTVDLTVIDQDENSTKLNTFNDITHVTLSSEGLIPEVELEVATKNEEDLEDSAVYAVHTLSEELNTLYNTAEKPVKSAILKGQTKIMDELENECESPNIPGFTMGGYINPNNGEVAASEVSFYTTFLKCPTVSFVIKGDNKYKRIIFYNKNKTFLRAINNLDATNTPIEISYSSIPSTAVYMRISASTSASETYTPNTILLIEDTNGNNLYTTHLESVKMPVLTTSNEDGAKTNILTVNEEVHLHKIGDVQDELNLITGELTQRIGEVVLYGSENWGMNTPPEEYSKPTIRVSCDKLIKGGYASGIKLISDKIPVGFAGYNYEFFGISALYSDVLYIQIPRTMIGLDLEENNATVVAQKFKEWFTTFGPVKVQYPLTTQSVKTVDLSVVDQDGDNTKLSTFNDITYVTLSSEGLIPEAELEVAEKVPEVAANMFTISREQEVINTTINEQSENVDATMIATTEIYEELL